MIAEEFSDNEINWQQLEGTDHLSYRILDVDRARQVVDVLFRFDANQKITLHRHVALNHMLVIQGEHRLYNADDTLKEIRPCGRYTVSPPSPEPHREGGGDQDAIVFFSIRGTDGAMYEILDDDQKLVGVLGMDEFEALFAAQDA